MAYNTTNIKKVALGTEAKSVAMIFKTNAPLDDRFSVTDKAALICQEVFGQNGNSDSKDWLYEGQSTTISTTGDTYVLSKKSALTLYPKATIAAHDETWVDAEIAKGWTKLAKASEVSALQTTVTQNMQALSGVFQFKGVATSITDDMDAISISTLTVTNTGAESPVSESGYELKSIQYDLTHQLFYGWKKTSPTNGFAQEYYTTDKDSKVYTKLGESNIVYVDIDGERYYTLSTSEGSIVSLQSLVGNTIYPESGIDSSALSYSSVNFYSNSTTKDNTTLVGQAIPQKNQAYMFSEVENFLVGNLTQIKVIPASGIVDGNTTTPVNGWVYQIGEKEYASNGLIWVELGSPKEEITWLVL